MTSSFDISVLTRSGALHETAVSLVRDLRCSELALAEVLGAVEASGEFRAYASSMADYARLIGLGRGKGRQLAVIGRALPRLPELHHVMRDGRIAWTAAFEVARVATAETESGWIRVAEEWPVRELRLAVSRSARGDEAPDLTERPGLGATTLSFELLPEDAQLVSRAMTLLRSRSASDPGEPASCLSDEELLVEMARVVVSGEAPAGGVSGERFVTVIRECPTCDAASLAGLGEGARATVSEPTRAMARCDAVVVDASTDLPAAQIGRGHSTVSPRVRRLVMDRDDYGCATPGCSNRLHLDVHHVVHREQGGGNELGNLVCLCTSCHRRTHEGLLWVGVDGMGGFRFRWAGASVGCSGA